MFRDSKQYECTGDVVLVCIQQWHVRYYIFPNEWLAGIRPDDAGKYNCLTRKLSYDGCLQLQRPDDHHNGSVELQPSQAGGQFIQPEFRDTYERYETDIIADCQ